MSKSNELDSESERSGKTDADGDFLDDDELSTNTTHTADIQETLPDSSLCHSTATEEDRINVSQVDPECKLDDMNMDLDKDYKQLSACSYPNVRRTSQDNETEELPDKKFLGIGKICGMSTAAKLTILSFCIAKFSIASFYGLLAPFFPGEAAKKGASPIAVGIIFSIYQGTIGLSSLILGNFITRIGARTMYVTGITVSGLSGILFGFIDLCPDGPVYIALAVIVRFVEGVGAGAFFTSGFAIIAHMFPENVAFLLGSFEMFTGLGIMTGPIIGGGLFELGGFRLPFITLGSLVAVIGVLNIFILPNHDVQLPPREGSVFGLLKVPLACIIGFCLTSGTGSMGFLDVTLSTFLTNQYKLSTVLVGFMFLVFSSMYALTAPIWGHLSDKFPGARLHYVAGGFGLAGIAQVLMGPASFLHIPHMLWLQIVSSALMGIGLGTLVLAFPLFNEAAVSMGYPDNIATYGLSAGIFNGFFSLGACLGPLVGGFLAERLSFESAVAIVGAWEILSALILIGYILLQSLSRSRGYVYIPLLSVESRRASRSSSLLVRSTPQTSPPVV